MAYIVILVLTSNTLLSQQVHLTQEELIFLGKVPQKSYVNFLVDRIDYMLSFNMPKDSTTLIGYLNKMGEIKIPPIFNFGLNFHNNYANIIKDSVYGYVDVKGEIKLFPQYKRTYFYYADIGVAYKDGAALIDRKGNLITKFIYSSISPCGEGYFNAKKGKMSFAIIDEHGKKILDRKNKILPTSHIFNSMTIYQDTINKKVKQGLIDIKGNIVLKAKYDGVVGAFNEQGLMSVQNDNKFGFVDIKGQEIIPLVYDKVESRFNEGLLAILKEGKWGYINDKNEIEVPFIYEEADGFSEGLARVKKNGKYGYIDKNNKIKIPFILKYSKNAFFVNGLAVYKNNGFYGFINKKGKVVIEAIYDLALPFYNKIAQVRLNGKEGFINSKGDEVIPIKFKQIWMESAGLFRFLK